jgi:hypothetical protein
MSEWGIDLNCFSCIYSNLELSKLGTCKAYPEGIPHSIASGEADHRKPVDGDKGIQYYAREKQNTR